MPESLLSPEDSPLSGSTSSKVDISGELLKAGETTRMLRSRFFVLSGRRLKYWMKAAHFQSGECPRGDMTVLDAKEWWPDNQLTDVPGSSDVLELVTAVVKIAWDPEYDGKGLVVSVSMGSKGEARLHLVAPSFTDKMRWLDGIKATTARTSRAGPPALTSGDPTPSTNTPNGPKVSSPSPEMSGIARDADRPTWRAAGLDGHLRAAVQALPRVWALWRDEGDLKGAQDEYTALVEAVPSCWQVLADRGVYYMHAGDLRRAEADLSCALQLESSTATVWSDRAECRLRSGDAEASLADADAALRLDSACAAAWCNRANAHRSKGEISLALDAMRTAKLLGTDDGLEDAALQTAAGLPVCRRTAAHIWTSSAELYDVMFHRLAAHIDVQHALAVEPEHSEAKAIAARLAQALQYEFSGGAEFELQPTIPFQLDYVDASERLGAGSTATREPVKVFTFGPGRVGISFEAHTIYNPRSNGACIVTYVAPRSQAAKERIPLHSRIIALNDEVLPCRIGAKELAARIIAAPRPLRMRVRVPDNDTADAPSSSGEHMYGDAACTGQDGFP